MTCVVLFRRHRAPSSGVRRGPIKRVQTTETQTVRGRGPISTHHRRSTPPFVVVGKWKKSKMETQRDFVYENSWPSIPAAHGWTRCAREGQVKGGPTGQTAGNPVWLTGPVCAAFLWRRTGSRAIDEKITFDLVPPVMLGTNRKEWFTFWTFNFKVTGLSFNKIITILISNFLTIF